MTSFYGFDIFTKHQGDKNQDPYLIYEPDSDCDKIILSVADNGVGVKKQDQTKLFKLFGCLQSTRQINTQGIGLGLVITKMITEEFGG